MVKNLLSGSHAVKNEPGSKRNHEVQRIETFSDGVFAFAVTLLIVSLEVPHSFEELVTTMRGFFAFGISFLLLVLIWNEQHRFFRNYGLDDSRTTVLNLTLLFIVLFYVYPLKFLFTLMVSDQMYGPLLSPFKINAHQYPKLMMIYAIGYIAIYSLFFLMYSHVNRQSGKLGLTPAEKFDSRSSMYRIAIMVLTGFGSLFAAYLLPENKAGLSGFVYFLMGPAISVLYYIRNKTRSKLYPRAIPAD